MGLTPEMENRACFALFIGREKRGGRSAAEKTLSFKARRIHVIPIKSSWVLPEGVCITDSKACIFRLRFKLFSGVESWNDLENKSFSTTYKKRGKGINLNLDEANIVPDDGSLQSF